MDCIKSFSLSTSANQTFAAPNYNTWGTANYWQVVQNGSSVFNIQGFKNINIHAIDVMGDFSGSSILASNGIVQDWDVGISITGQSPQTNGNLVASPNFLSLSDVAPLTNQFTVSRYKTKIELASPIQSAKTITFSQYKAYGYGAQNPLQIVLIFNLNFVFYYTFEGE